MHFHLVYFACIAGRVLEPRHVPSPMVPFLGRKPAPDREDVLTTALGDSRKLLARQFYVKADAYFHSGYYPTIFDAAKPSDKLHIAATAQGQHEEEGADFLGKPKDWIDSFGRHFFPSEHRHLGEDPDHHDEHGDEHHEEHGKQGEERELLPWLKLAATLDPERPETYIVTSFWLRSQLDKPNEAEQFLREGLRANPGHPEMLFELGRHLPGEPEKHRTRAQPVGAKPQELQGASHRP